MQIDQKRLYYFVKKGKFPFNHVISKKEKASAASATSGGWLLFP